MPNDPGSRTATDRLRARTIWSVLVFLVVVVLAFAVLRVVVDVPNLAEGEIPEDGFERRYALHPVIAYAHILPGVIYLIGAPFQLNRGFRERHFALHRRMGRVLVPAGIASGVLGIIFGSRFAFGGLLESSATVVFGVYFVAALSIAFLAIKAGDVTRHRRWMIRAFAIGLAVGTIRVWVGVFQGFGLLSMEDSFGIAFWLSFLMHAAAAEAYLAWRPNYEGAASAHRDRSAR